MIKLIYGSSLKLDSPFVADSTICKVDFPSLDYGGVHDKTRRKKRVFIEDFIAVVIVVVVIVVVVVFIGVAAD